MRKILFITILVLLILLVLVFNFKNNSIKLNKINNNNIDFNNSNSIIESFNNPYLTVKIDAAFLAPKGETKGEMIIFRKDKWLLYDVSTMQVKKGAYTIPQHSWFKGLPEPFDSDLDAIIRRPTDPNKEIIFFKGEHWLLWDYINSKVSSGPHKIRTHRWFSGLPPSFQDGISSAVISPENHNHIIFFKENRYLVWDFYNDKIHQDASNFDSSSHFVKIDNHFRNGIDAAVSNPLTNGELFLFKDDKYLIWNYLKKIPVGPVRQILSDPVFKSLGMQFSEEASKVSHTAKRYHSIDSSKYGNHSTLINVEEVGNLPFNKGFAINNEKQYQNDRSLKFNGIDSVVEIGNPKVNDLYKNQAFCMGFYIKLSEYFRIPSKRQVLASCYGPLIWTLSLNETRKLEFSVKEKNSEFASIIVTNNKINDEWHYVCFGQNSYQQFLQIDQFRNQKASPIFEMKNEPVNVILGADGPTPRYTKFFDGLIGQPRIYNKILTKNQVCSLSNLCDREKYKLHLMDAETSLDRDTNIDTLETDSDSATTNNCLFKAKGKREIDCLKDCYDFKDVNGCDIEDCMKICGSCQDSGLCEWKQKSREFSRPQPRNNPDMKDVECRFRPYGENIKQCVEICNDFSENCDDSRCLSICNDCVSTGEGKNNNEKISHAKSWCKWLEDDVESDSNTPQAPPNPPRLFGVSGVNSIELLWNKPTSNPEVTDFMLMYYETQDPTQNDVVKINISAEGSGEHFSKKIRAKKSDLLPPGSDDNSGDSDNERINRFDSMRKSMFYTFIIYARNLKGFSNPSNKIVLKLGQDSTGLLSVDTGYSLNTKQSETDVSSDTDNNNKNNLLTYDQHPGVKYNDYIKFIKGDFKGDVGKITEIIDVNNYKIKIIDSISKGNIGRNYNVEPGDFIPLTNSVPPKKSFFKDLMGKTLDFTL